MKFEKYYFILLLLFFVIFTANCNKNDSDAYVIPENIEKNPLAVIITPNTALRIDPLIFTSRIAQLKKGEVGEVIGKSSEMKTVGKAQDYWYKIKLANGISGWVFGSNMNILKDSDKGHVASYLSEFWEKETSVLGEALHGKWWSINKFNDFTNHCLEIYKDGKYKSYFKGSQRKIEGEYNFDFNNSRIIFLKGTSFEGDLNYFQRGDEYTLIRESETNEIRFKKININPEAETEIEKSNPQDSNDSGDNIKKENEG
ncbi:MAG: SH3 domain-containing protein [Spirochaetes bacterium]|nr:SH3 domain-containing protein [Spirochaetota bacterium]